MRPAHSRLALPRLAVERSDEEVVKSAYHEAAHAVVGSRTGVGVPIFATIDRVSNSWIRMANRASEGLVVWRWSLRDRLAAAQGSRRVRRVVESDVMTSLAGHAEEAVLDADCDSLEVMLAWEEVMFADVLGALGALALIAPVPHDRWRLLRQLAVRTKRLLRRPGTAAAVERVAEALLDAGTLEGDALARALTPPHEDVRP